MVHVSGAVVCVVVVVCVLGLALGDPCYTCGNGGRGYATAGALASAGSFANSYGNGRASSHANSQASSYAHGTGRSVASSQASSYASSSSGGFGGPGYFGHPSSCSGCGCGGCDGACGWCGGNFGRRKRRNVQDISESTELMQLYSQIANEDKDECGLRLVCELAQKDPRDLAPVEVEILLPYRGEGESDGTAFGKYDEAAWHGQEGRPCHTIYPLCAFTADQIMADYTSFKEGILEASQE